VDCTPEEARGFLGLPDVAPLQQEMMSEIQRRIAAGVASMDPEALMKTWLPAGMQGMEQLQKAFWQQMGQATGSGTKPGKKK
jgi:Tfp pilus assembly PilM family ATPase